MSLNFQNIKGDTFEEVNFEVKINDVAVDLTDSISQAYSFQLFKMK